MTSPTRSSTAPGAGAPRSSHWTARPCAWSTRARPVAIASSSSTSRIRSGCIAADASARPARPARGCSTVTAIMTFVLVALGAGIAVSVELLEALAIVLAVGASRRWGDALIGAAGAVARVRPARGGARARRAGLRAARRAARDDRRPAAAVRPGVAAQGDAAAGRAARPLVLARGVRRDPGGAARRAAPAGWAGGLGGPHRGLQGRLARGRRGGRHRLCARRAAERAGAGAASAPPSPPCRGGRRRMAAPAAGPHPGDRAQVGRRRAAERLRRVLRRGGAGRGVARRGRGDPLPRGDRVGAVSQAQAHWLAREPVPA